MYEITRNVMLPNPGLTRTT